MSEGAEDLELLVEGVLRTADGQDTLRARVDEQQVRFDALDLRLARFESGLGALEARMGRMGRRVDRIDWVEAYSRLPPGDAPSGGGTGCSCSGGVVVGAGTTGAAAPSSPLSR